MDGLKGGGSDFVQSLERGLAVIRAFDADHSHLTLSELARATGLNRAAARRFVLTLVQLGYVGSDGKTFSLRPRILDLGYAYLSGLGLPEIAHPHLEALVTKIGESSSISVLDGRDIVYVARVPTRRIMSSVSVSVGTRLPAYATAMGRVLLAGLDETEQEEYLATIDKVALTTHTVTDPDKLRQILRNVSAQGWAIVDQEVEDGIRSIAVPICDAAGRPIAAMNAGLHATRASVAALKRDFLPPLRETAALIEADLHANRRPVTAVRR